MPRLRRAAKRRPVVPQPEYLPAHSQVALSWVTNRPGVTAPIIGARTLDQLEQNLIGGDLVLSQEHTARLDEVSAPTPNDYPYGPFGVKQRDRYRDSSDQAIGELF